LIDVKFAFYTFNQNLKLKPEFLQKGDKIAILAPSGRVFKEELEESIDFLISLGLVPVLGRHLFEDFNRGYHFAGSIQQRKEDFQNAVDEEEFKAIWCARGGYGAVHLPDLLDWEKFLQKPKWIIGYSDITVFHNHLNNWDIATLHAVTLKKLNLKYNEESFNSLKQALFGEELRYEIPAHRFNKIGKSRGKLVGGNLSIIYSLNGSISSIQGENLILFIEDWNENWYHLDRMLMSLKRSGLLSKIKGLILGSFTRMDKESENPEFHSEYDSMSYQIIQELTQNYEIPTCYRFPAGHIGDNRALIMGSEVELIISEDKVNLKFI
jgi:muramoyltetrapeptide carboxypeptidase